MSEVKRYDCTNGKSQYCYGCYQMEEVDEGAWVQAIDFDAQRLRADTAEAERDALKDDVMSLSSIVEECGRERAAAEHRIAELSANNQQLRKLLGQTLAALNPTKALSKSIRAALNPNPEAESHG